MPARGVQESNAASGCPEIIRARAFFKAGPRILTLKVLEPEGSLIDARQEFDEFRGFSARSGSSAQEDVPSSWVKAAHPHDAVQRPEVS